ncbi:MAG: XdhC family protein [Thermodesulfobacteriota bacterium]
MLEVFKRLGQELAAGRPAVMASIIHQVGSSPRSLGSRFLVLSDGSLVGSIGGGGLEARVIGAAQEMMGSDSASVMEIRMTGKEVAGTDMLCGGNVDVLVQGFSPASWNGPGREVLEGVLRLLEKGGRGILMAGPLPDKGRTEAINMYFHRPGQELTGAASGDRSRPSILTLLETGAERVLGTNTTRIMDSPGGRYVLEPLYSNPTAIIFGGGHISVNLAPLLALVEFRVVVVDDRMEFAHRDRFPHAAEIVVANFKDCLDRLNFTPETYSVIVTRGHLHDKTVLAGVLARPFRYVGMIGSRRKRNMVFDALMKEGVNPELIKKIHSPIGLDIGAETAEEIAVSIAAEMIKVRAENLRLVKDWKV